jgi:hypothetical protein
MRSMQTQHPELKKALPTIQYVEAREFDTLDNARAAYREIVERFVGVPREYEFGASTVVHHGHNVLLCVAAFEQPPEDVQRGTAQIMQQHGGRDYDVPISLVEVVVWRRAQGLLSKDAQHSGSMFTVRRDGINERIDEYGRPRG